MKYNSYLPASANASEVQTRLLLSPVSGLWQCCSESTENFLVLPLPLWRPRPNINELYRLSGLGWDNRSIPNSKPDLITSIHIDCKVSVKNR